jgi:hypothetical protein
MGTGGLTPRLVRRLTHAGGIADRVGAAAVAPHEAAGAMALCPRGKKERLMKKRHLVVAVLCLLPTASFADDVYDVLKKLPIQRPNPTTQTLNSTLFAASVTMTLQDGDGNNANFSDADTMQQLVLRSIGGTLAFPAGNKSAIDQFARAHTQEIIDILFPSGLAANTMGQSENQFSAALVFDEVVTPIKSPRGSERRRLKNELSGRLEYDQLTLNHNDGYSVGTLLGYRRDISSRLEVGLLVPYRFTRLDDPAETKAHFAQFDLFGAYTPYEGDVTVKLGAEAFTSVLVSQSKAIDVLGDLTYGGGLFSSLEKDFKVLIVTFGLGFKVSKTTIEFVPHREDFLGDIIRALNDREVDRDLTYGVNIAIPYGENLILNLGAHRTNSFASDVPSDRNAQTKLRAVLQYKLARAFELNGGYSTIFEIKDYTPHIFFINAIARF